MPRNKILKENKLDAVIKILDGKSSISSMAKKLQVSYTAVESWIRIVQYSICLIAVLSHMKSATAIIMILYLGILTMQ